MGATVKWAKWPEDGNWDLSWWIEPECTAAPEHALADENPGEIPGETRMSQRQPGVDG